MKYATLADLIEQEIVPAIGDWGNYRDCVEIAHRLEQERIITYTNGEFVLEIDEYGNTPGFWDIAMEVLT